jgi:hypothetical protein
MGFEGGSRPQGSGTRGVTQAVMQARSGDGGGTRQSHAVQKLQSICAHISTVFRSCRQDAMQAAFVYPFGPVVEQMPPIIDANGCPAQSACTRVTCASHVVAGFRSSHATNWPPPQTQSIVGLHSEGHQQAVVSI